MALFPTKKCSACGAKVVVALNVADRSELLLEHGQGGGIWDLSLCDCGDHPPVARPHPITDERLFVEHVCSS